MGWKLGKVAKTLGREYPYEKRFSADSFCALLPVWLDSQRGLKHAHECLGHRCWRDACQDSCDGAKGTPSISVRAYHAARCDGCRPQAAGPRFEIRGGLRRLTGAREWRRTKRGS